MNPEMPSPQPAAASESDRLDSWKQIAAYLAKSERTVRRWQQTEGLPVHRHVHQQRGSVWAYRKELDEWFEGRRLSPEPPNDVQEPPNYVPEPQRRLGRWGIRARSSIAVTSLAAIVAVGWAVVEHSRPPSATPISESVPLTAMLGAAYGATFSPDSRQVAFHWGPLTGADPGIYLKSIGSDTVTPLVTNKWGQGKFSYGPAWSPDGKTIAFLRRVFPQPNFSEFATKSETWLYLIDSSGGPERRLIRLATNIVFYANSTHLSWTPDSQWIVAPMADGERRGIHRISVAGAEARLITNTPDRAFAPLLSPDGRALVFMRREAPHLSSMEQLFRQNLAADMSPQGAPQLLYQGRSTPSGLAWAPSGRELIFCIGDRSSFGPFANSQLYRLRADTPSPKVSLGVRSGCSTVSISRSDGSGRAMLVYGSVDNTKSGLWQADIGALQRAAPLAPSSRFDGLPSYSPDGSLVAFVSNRSGNPEVWVTQRDGTGVKKITENSQISSAPRWSPDGSRLLYGAPVPPREAALRAALNGLYIVPIAGGAPSRVGLGLPSASDPFWSRDGQWIYYWSDSQLWRTRTDATGSVMLGEYPWQFIRPGIADGGHIYYTRSGKPFELCRAAVETHTEEVVAEELLTPFFAVTPKFVYFIKQAERSLFALPRTGGPLRRIGSMPQMEGRHRLILGMSVSPDDASVVWAVTGEQQIDLQLVRDFR
jgi:Tol biopolymer transport system component